MSDITIDSYGSEEIYIEIDNIRIWCTHYNVETQDEENMIIFCYNRDSRIVAKIPCRVKDPIIKYETR